MMPIGMSQGHKLVIVDMDLRISCEVERFIDTSPMKVYLGYFEFRVVSAIRTQVSTATTIFSVIATSQVPFNGSSMQCMEILYIIPTFNVVHEIPVYYAGF